MPSEPGILEQIAGALAGIFRPLGEHADEGTPLQLVAELGIQFPASLASDPTFISALAKIATAARLLPGRIKSLSAALASDNHQAKLEIDFELINLISELIGSIGTVANAIEAKKNTFPGLTPGEVESFAIDFPKRLLDHLLIRQVEVGVPSVAACLDFVGIFDRTEQNVGSVSPLKPPFTRRVLNLGRIAEFLKSPGTVLQTRYGWGSPGFDGSALLQKLEKLALELSLPAVYTNSGTPTLDLMFLEVQPKTDVSPPGLKIQLHSPLQAANTFATEGTLWAMEFGTDIQVPVQSVLTLHPDGSFAITSPSTPVKGKFQATFRTKPDPASNSFIMLGEAAGSRLEFKEFRVGATAELLWDPAANVGNGDYTIDAAIKDGQLVIDFSKADGFLGKILSAVKFSAPFNVAMGVSRDGFYFYGSGGLEIQLPVHLDLAVVELTSLTIGVGLKPEGLPVSLAADLKARLGPLVAVVENVGMRATFSFADKHDGNLGPLDLGFDFKPPNGVGLSIDAAAVRGGGYLYFDTDKEEYAGALELSVMDIVTVKAIGLITTRMPDGSKGFALLIIISAEFTAIQLGFGFTLIGLGGLLGLNRTMQLEQIATGVRTGGINSIMFPKDVVANAPRIISDLRIYFPPQEGRFLIGLMAKIGWGTPTLASISLGVVVEIPPGKLAILGIVKVALPAEDAPLIVLQVNFIGAIEPDKDRLWFFAELFESRVLFISIEGGMGLLMAWGANANFVLSVGGFHPRFSPPPLPFPVPHRVALDILNTPLSRIRVEGYFAVTSNTAQFGARVELRLGFSEIGVFGHLAFDALFQFSPFYFIIEISGSVELKVFGLGLFSIRLELSLEGPTPWRARGTGTLSLLFFDISADFDITWGDKEDTTLPAMPVMPLLANEFNKTENWRAELPHNNNLQVSLRPLEPAAGLVLHPIGTLVVSQRAVPLGLDIARIGSQKVADAKHFTVKPTTSGLGKNGDRKEQFAMGQFLDLNNGDKLSRKSYELQNGGLELSVVGRQAVTSRAVKRTVRYEMIVFDSKYKRKVIQFFMFAGSLFAHFLRGNAVAKSPLSQATQKLYVPFDEKVKVQQEGYVVATNFDNKPFSAQKARFDSEAQAHDFLNAQMIANPELRDVLHVIPRQEAVGYEFSNN